MKPCRSADQSTSVEALCHRTPRSRRCAVYDYAQMLADPQVRHRGLVQYAVDPELGEGPHIRTPVKIGEGVQVRNVAPKLGQHNPEIFGRLRVKDAEIWELRAKRVL
jgi:crotonobetainyl-CoA:carnitine CoA-transferase CaiB-like acyl-CoA transferase